MTPKEFIVVCKQNNNEISRHSTLLEAEKQIEIYENEDIKEGNFELNFYDIIEFTPEPDPKEEYFKEQNNYPAKIGGHYGC